MPRGRAAARSFSSMPGKVSWNRAIAAGRTACIQTGWRGMLELRLSRYGPFVGCADYPACGYRRRLAAGAGEGYTGPRELGTDPGSGLVVTLRRDAGKSHCRMAADLFGANGVATE